MPTDDAKNVAQPGDKPKEKIEYEFKHNIPVVKPLMDAVVAPVLQNTLQKVDEKAQERQKAREEKIQNGGLPEICRDAHVDDKTAARLAVATRAASVAQSIKQAVAKHGIDSLDKAIDVLLSDGVKIYKDAKNADKKSTGLTSIFINIADKIKENNCVEVADNPFARDYPQSKEPPKEVASETTPYFRLENGEPVYTPKSMATTIEPPIAKDNSAQPMVVPITPPVMSDKPAPVNPPASKVDTSTQAAQKRLNAITTQLKQIQNTAPVPPIQAPKDFTPDSTPIPKLNLPPMNTIKSTPTPAQALPVPAKMNIQAPNNAGPLHPAMQARPPSAAPTPESAPVPKPASTIVSAPAHKPTEPPKIDTSAAQVAKQRAAAIMAQRRLQQVRENTNKQIIAARQKLFAPSSPPPASHSYVSTPSSSSVPSSLNSMQFRINAPSKPTTSAPSLNNMQFKISAPKLAPLPSALSYRGPGGR